MLEVRITAKKVITQVQEDYSRNSWLQLKLYTRGGREEMNWEQFRRQRWGELITNEMWRGVRGRSRLYKNFGVECRG
jgi:hypothetical protein